MTKPKNIRANGKVFRVVTPADLCIDEAYQRGLDERRARKIGEDFSDELFGVPVVSERSDGKLYVIDGQHRVCGLNLTGGGSRRITVQVCSGLTQAQEAELFHRLQRDRSAVRAIDAYRARLVYCDPIVVEMDAAIRASGLRVSHVAGPRQIAAVVAIEAVYTKHGNLMATLDVLRTWADVCGGDPKAYDGQVIRFVGYFLSEFPVADATILANQLAKYGTPNKLLAAVRNEMRSYGDIGKWETSLGILAEVYNKRNRRKLKRSDRRGSKLTLAA